MTANVGRLAVEPGGANVVPGLADFTIDVRATTAAGLAELEALVEETVARVADDEGLEADLEQTFALDPLALDPELVDTVERAAADEGASSLRLPSGAGHDAMVIGRHVPAAMLFVPSRRRHQPLAAGAQLPRPGRDRDAGARGGPPAVTANGIVRWSMRVVGVDIGGTFTDFMLYDTESGDVHVHKVPSTPGEPERAMVERPRRALRRAPGSRRPT